MLKESYEASIVRPPEGWNPPKKLIAGVDLVKYFSNQFLSEVTAMLLKQTSHNTQLPLFLGMEDVSREIDTITGVLKGAGVYEHPDGGHLFLDYKVMRSKAHIKLGRAAGILNDGEALIDGHRKSYSGFKLMMSTQEAMGVARAFVETWDWAT